MCNPNATNGYIICLYLKYEPDEQGKSFLQKVKDFLNNSGYDFFGARYYASALPSWLSVDPLAGKYPGISPYAYCAWNPIKYIDPDGMYFDEANEIIARKIEDECQQKLSSRVINLIGRKK